MPNHYRKTAAAVHRIIDNELIVIQSDSGTLYHFSPNTETLINLFSVPTSVDDLFHLLKITQDETERKYMADFVKSLVEKGILEIVVASSDIGEEKQARIPRYERPIFIKKGEKSLDDISVFASA